MATADEKYLSLTTFTKSGKRKPTAVWIAAVDGSLGFTTGADAWKLKRLRNDPRCELQPCDSRGRVSEGSIVVTGKGREADPQEYEQIRAAIDNKYGLSVKLIEGSMKLRSMVTRQPTTPRTAIVIDLD